MRTTSFPSGVADAAAIAKDAFVLGYPLVLSEHMLAAGPPNRFAHAALHGGMLRSTAWLDLGGGPVVLTVPDTYGRCYALALVDAWTGVFGSIGSRTTGSRGGAYAICGPGFTGALPEDAIAIRAPTRIARITGGVEADGRELQDAIRLHAPATALAGARATVRPEAMAPAEYFGRLALLMRENPPRLEDRVVVDRMRELGLLAADGVERLDGELRAAVARGTAQGRDAVLACAQAPAGEPVGGWRVRFGDGGCALRRAGAACAGIEPGPPEDALGALASEDAGGRPLTGRHGYRLRFPGAPVVHGFWTLTTRDDHGHEYAVRDWNGLTLDPDGALTIEIGHRPRTAEPGPNWLPAPPGPFSVVLRLQWPAQEVFARGWRPPDITRIE